MVTPHSGFFDSSVHSLYLTISPWVLYFCQPVLNAVLVTDSVKRSHESHVVTFTVSELDPVVG